MRRYLATALALALSAPLPAIAQPGWAGFDWFEYSGADAKDAVAPGPDEYRNPILQGFYPDPSTTRVGDDFYLVTSTFGWFPGIPVFHSKDLVHWTQIGNAIDRPSQLDFKQLGLSRGVFAPTIEHHGDTFYILNTCVDCGGNFVITAKDPAGPWSDPVWLPALEGGIDPSLFFDEDGRSWVINNGAPVGEPEYSGHRAIWIQEIDQKTLKTFGPRTLLVNGGVDFSKKPIWIEGPHIFKKDGWYYLCAAEGGTAEGHSQVILRSKNVTGPFVPGPNNPILTQRDLPRDRAMPITSAGHAQLFTTPDGKWWSSFLAVRPYEGDYYNTGRETFLLPVEWKDGWPVILPHGTAIPYTAKAPILPAQPAGPVPTSGPFTVREEFDGTKLPSNWMMMRQPRSDWYALKDGSLRLQPRAVGLGDLSNPSFVARRQQHMDARAETVVRFTPGKDGDRAGLVALQNDKFWAAISIGMVGGQPMILLEGMVDGDTSKIPFRAAPLTAKAGDPVSLRIEAKGPEYSFSYAQKPGDWRSLGSIDGKFLSTRDAGGFVGAVFGLYAQSGE